MTVQGQMLPQPVCIICGKTETQEADEQEAAGYDREGFSMKSQGEPWCGDCWEFYNVNRQHFHPIRIKGRQRIGPPSWGAAGMAPVHKTLPAYFEEAVNWQSIGFDVDKMRQMMAGTYTPPPTPPPTPKPSIQAPSVGPTTDVCACCKRNVKTSFHHENKWPRTDGYDYCSDCNNAGCGDPDDHCLLTEEVLKVAEHTMQITERAKKEMQLKAGIGSDGGNLSDAERAEITAWLEQANKADEMALRTAGDTTTPEPTLPPTGGLAAGASILDQIMAQQAAAAEATIQPGEQHVTVVEQLTAQQGVEVIEDARSLQVEGLTEEERESLGSVTVLEHDGTDTGERISFAEAAGRVHGLPPEQVAELERLRQQANATAQPQYEAGGGLVQPGPRPDIPNQPAAPAPTMGPSSPLLNSISVEDAREEIVATLEACENPSAIVNELFLGLLDALDPTDSDVHLALFQRLQASGRVHKMGTLDQPLSGYIYFYQEPKGTSKEGYTPGGTQGGRMVDNAKAKIADSGVTVPTKRGICSNCMTVVHEDPTDGRVLSDSEDSAICRSNPEHGHNLV